MKYIRVLLFTMSKPGRPRKIATDDTPKRLGVLKAPINADNIIEVEFPSAKIFKELILNMKACQIVHIIIHFTKEYLQIISECGTYVIMMRGVCMNSYYCARDRIVHRVSLQDMAHLLSQIDANNNHFSMHIMDDVKMRLRTKKAKFESTCTEIIPFNMADDVIPEAMSFDHYMLNFNVLSAELCSNFKYIGKTPSCVIEKSGSSGITIHKGNTNNTGREISFPDCKNTSMQETDMLHVTFPTDRIKSFTGAHFGTMSTLYVDNDKPIRIQTQFDDYMGMPTYELRFSVV